MSVQMTRWAGLLAGRSKVEVIVGFWILVIDLILNVSSRAEVKIAQIKVVLIREALVVLGKSGLLHFIFGEVYIRKGKLLCAGVVCHFLLLFVVQDKQRLGPTHWRQFNHSLDKILFKSTKSDKSFLTVFNVFPLIFSESWHTNIYLFF